MEKVLDDAFNNFGTEIAAKLTNIEMRIHSRIDGLLGESQTQEDTDSDIDMEDSEVEILDDHANEEDSANSTASEHPNVTATGQSPPKKQKGGPSSDNE